MKSSNFKGILFKDIYIELMDFKGHPSPPPNKNINFDTIQSPWFQELSLFFGDKMRSGLRDWKVNYWEIVGQMHQ